MALHNEMLFGSSQQPALMSENSKKKKISKFSSGFGHMKSREAAFVRTGFLFVIIYHQREIELRLSSKL